MNKDYMLCTLLNKWLDISLSGHSLAEYFEKLDYQHVIIYGAFDLGYRLYDDLTSHGIMVDFFIDKEKVGSYGDADILSFDDLENFEEKSLFCPIIIAPIWCYDSIIEDIQNWRKNLSQYLISLGSIVDTLHPKKVIPYMVLSVGQLCNFKCKNCGVMAPYAKKEFMKYDVDSLINDLSLITEQIDSIQSLQIQGGEPFIYNELGELLMYVGGNKKIKSVVIATNGSVMPNDELLKIIKENHITVRISDYNVVQEKAELLYKKLKKTGIRSYYYKFTTGKSQWYYKGIHVKKEENDDIVIERFNQCKNNMCLTLERGRLCYCSRSTNAYAIQQFTDNPEDSLTIDSRKTLGEDIMKFICEKHFVEACRYCYGTDANKMIEAAEQLVEK